jgi:hypothetical protein
MADLPVEELLDYHRRSRNPVKLALIGNSEAT